jgi:DnaJ-like protein
MSRSLRSLVERQIQKARARGDLDGLEGEGKPLPDRPEDRATDPGLAAGMRIMAQAGVVPEEFDLKQKLDAARVEYSVLTDLNARKSAMARIADLEMRYNLARDARKSFFR